MQRCIHKVAFILHSSNAAIVTKWIQNIERPLSFKKGRSLFPVEKQKLTDLQKQLKWI